MKYRKFVLKSYGVLIGIECNDAHFLQKLLKGIGEILPGGFETIDPGETPCVYRINFVKENWLEFYIDGVMDVETDSFQTFYTYFLSILRLRIAERAVERVFIHSGAVVWKEQAIIFPANSFQGKTTLAAELVRNGALYLSDEYAVLDEDGFVHPFQKMLSVRGIENEYLQTETPVEEFGSNALNRPYPVGMVIFTEFEKGGEWKPEIKTPGEGMLEIISHTIPIRYNPKFSLKVLNKVLNRAIIAKSKRGDSKDFVKKLFEFFENHLK